MSEQSKTEQQSNTDQGADLGGDGETRICPLCGSTVEHAIGSVRCVGPGGWHADRPRTMLLAALSPAESPRRYDEQAMEDEISRLRAALSPAEPVRAKPQLLYGRSGPHDPPDPDPDFPVVGTVRYELHSALDGDRGCIKRVDVVAICESRDHARQWMLDHGDEFEQTRDQWRRVADRVLAALAAEQEPVEIKAERDRYWQALVDIADWENWQAESGPTWREIAKAAFSEARKEDQKL